MADDDGSLIGDALENDRRAMRLLVSLTREISGLRREVHELRGALNVEVGDTGKTVAELQAEHLEYWHGRPYRGGLTRLDFLDAVLASASAGQRAGKWVLALAGVIVALGAAWAALSGR